MDNNDFFLNNKPFSLPSYTVTYGLFTDPNKYKWNSMANPYETFNVVNVESSDTFYVTKNTACFSNLGSQLRKEELKDSNRIVYYFKPHIKVSKEEMLRWLLLAKQNKLLPRYTNVKKIVESNCVIFDIKGVTFNLLYAYLSTVRMLIEDPQYVKNVLVMVDKYKINYFVAIVASTYLGFRNFGHAFFSPSNTYPASTSPNTLTKIQLRTVLGVYRFIKRAGPVDLDSSRTFSATNKVNSLSSSGKLLELNKLVNMDFTPVLEAETDQEAEKALQKLTEA